ncbi:hypothetical protein [Streptomyces bambusae]|nr:hypothetical protein [Streptomyces bambusae]
MLHFIGLVSPLQQWWRRQVLVLATYGIDLGPRIIHGRVVVR